MIEQAARDSIPAVAPMFWTFRVMVGLGFSFAAAVRALLLVLGQEHFPGQALAAALGGVVHPAAVDRLANGLVRRGIRPPAVDHLRRAADAPVGLHPVGQQPVRLAGRIRRSSTPVLLVVEMYLMFKYARLGPASLGTGRYARRSCTRPATR